MTEPAKAVTFQAVFAKAATTADHGWNVTLALPDTEALRVTQLAALKGMLLQVAVVPVEE